MGCPFVFVKKMPYPLALLKHCIIISGDFWDVRAFFPLLFTALVGNRRGINNGILEATSIRGLVQIERPLFVYIDIPNRTI